MKQVVLTYGEVMQRIHQIAAEICTLPVPVRIHGIPRGGVPVAMAIAAELGNRAVLVDDVEQADVVVDDIIATGRTRAWALNAARPGVPFHAVVPTPAPGVWYAFPWEGGLDGSIEDSVVRQLQYIGEDPKRDGLVDTPQRVAKAMRELYSGYNENPAEILKRQFDNDGQYDEMVVLRRVGFFSTCEHHMMPFYGDACVAYIPAPEGRIVGISKLARLVECFARRLQVQERLTAQIADAVWEELVPLGVGVVLRAKHLCMVARGAKKEEAEMVTCALRGVFKTRGEARSEFLTLAERSLQG